MWRKRSSRRFSAEADDGFTLIEILVTTAIVTVVLSAVSGVILGAARYRREAEVRLETHHGLRSAADALMRDGRVAGACLPSVGTFLALGGVDAGTSDELTVRAGRLSSLVCVLTTLTATMPAGSVQVDVDDGRAFVDRTKAYLIHPNGSGEFLKIAKTQHKKITFETGIKKEYPAGSGLYAVQERTYGLGFDVSGVPMLTVAIDGGAPQPLALGIASLDVRYRLRRNCPPCDVVPLPADDIEWRLVTDLEIDVSGSFPSTLRAGGAYGVTETLRVRPRNLLP